jgi:hypothetical protein
MTEDEEPVWVPTTGQQLRGFTPFRTEAEAIQLGKSSTEA